MSVNKGESDQSFQGLFTIDFFKTLIATVIGTVLGSNTGLLSKFAETSQAEVTLIAVFASIPFAIGIHLFYRRVANRNEVAKRERELARLRIYKDWTLKEEPSSEGEVLISGTIQFSGVLIRAYLYNSGEIVRDGFLCPLCYNELHYPTSPKPQDLDTDTISDFEQVNYSNRDAVIEEKKEGGLLWALECTSESCEYIRYAQYNDLHDQEYQIKSIFKKHFERIKNSSRYNISSERPSIVWEKYAYTVDDKEVRGSDIQLSYLDRLVIKIRS